MESQAFEHSRFEPVPFPLPTGGYTVSAPGASFFTHSQSALTDEDLQASHFLRGFCWAMVIEAIAAFCLYEAWHLWPLLR
jgi:hypothetical protein